MRFFHQTSEADFANTHAAIDGGVHVAALGGMWIMALLGFAGLTMDEFELRLDPHLPDGWRDLAFSVHWRGRHVSISVDSIRKAIRATLTSGEPMAVTIDEEQHPLTRETSLTLTFGVKCMA